MYTKVKTAAEIEAMREGGKMLAAVLGMLSDRLQPDMTTKDLADIAKAEIKALGGTPTFLGQYGFPDVLCVSVNDAVVHGIPSAKHVIRNGDIVSMDFGVTYRGLITDAAVSRIAGKAQHKKFYELVNATEAALLAGIETVQSGTHVGDIAHAVESSLKYDGSYGIVRDLVGHGVGHELHEEPNIPNYGKAGSGPQLRAGMTIAIEPMVTLGTYQVYVDVDEWTIRTNDGSWAAHFEHTVLVTDTGYEILTALDS
jgi:methionyl aminopeptidase